MSAVDSNDKARENNKAFYEKKQQNDKQFVELCYKEFYAVINMYQNLMQRMKEASEQAEIEGTNKFLHEKNQEEFINSINAYNDTINKLMTKDSYAENQELLDKLKRELDGILEQIGKIKSYIQELNQRIIEKTSELTQIMKNIASEIKKFFVEDNPEINIRSQMLNILLSPSQKNILGMEKFEVEIDKLMYLRFAKILGNKFADDQIQFEQIKSQARKAAIEMIREELLARVSHLPQAQQVAIIDDIMKNSNTSQEIDRIANQLSMQFFRDLSKGPAMADFFNKGCHVESEIKLLGMEKQAAEIQIAKLQEAAAAAAESLMSPNLSHVQIQSILADVQAANAETTIPLPALAIATTAFDKTKECVSAIEKVKEEAKTELTSETATEKLTASISQIQQITASQQEILDMFDDFLSPKETSRQTLQSDTPTPH